MLNGPAAGDERHQPDNQKHNEQDLRDTGRCARYASESKNGGDDRDDQENQ